MQDMYMDHTSGKKAYDDSMNYGCFVSKAGFILYVLTWMVLCIGFPLIIVATVAVYFLIQKDHITPIYIINLFMSDLVQLCCIRVMVTETACDNNDILHVYYFGEMASVGFMVCVSLDRCLVIAFPLWYRYRRTIKSSVIVSIVVWLLPLVYVLPSYFWVDVWVSETIYVIFHLIPLPLFIFFLVGTLIALSSARSVPSDEERRIVAILVVVLLIYTLLFLPEMIWSLVYEARNNSVFTDLSFYLLELSPLANLTMYVFIRKGAIDNLLSSLCCDRMDSDADHSSTVLADVSRSAEM